MNDREFTMVSPAVWSSERFIRLDDAGRLLLLYFISGPHQTKIGCARIREAYALADLGWTADKYRPALASLIDAGLILHDATSSEVYVLRWFDHKGSLPTNKDHARGWQKLVSKNDSDTIRQQVEVDFMSTKWGAQIAPPANDEPASKAPFSHVSESLLKTRLLKTM